MPPGRGGGNAKVVHPGITEIFTKFNCNYCQVGVLYNILPYNAISVVSQDSFLYFNFKEKGFFFLEKIRRNIRRNGPKFHSTCTLIRLSADILSCIHSEKFSPCRLKNFYVVLIRRNFAEISARYSGTKSLLCQAVSAKILLFSLDHERKF